MELKPGYKQTEVGVIPEDWDCVHIGDVAETSSGATPSRAKQQEYFDGGTIPWVKTLDLNNSSILDTDECVTPSALQQTSLRLYPRGAVLVAMYGGFNQIGRTGMLTKKATINQALTAIRPDPSRLSSKFLLNYLNFRVEYWKSVASSSRKDPNITGRDVREFPIALPPLREQEAAGEALQDIEDQIFMLGELIAKKTEIKQAAMQELLTGKRRLPGFEGEWETKRLGDIAILNRNNILPAMYPGKLFTHFSLPAFDAGKTAPIEPGTLIGSNKFSVPTSAVLVSKLNPRIPRAWAPEIVPPNAIASTEWLVLTPKDEIERSYLFALCSSPDFCGQMELAATGTTGSHQRISPTIALDIPIKITPLRDEQIAISSVLSDMNTDLLTIEERLRKARELKQGMMQQLLTGKVRLI